MSTGGNSQPIPQRPHQLSAAFYLILGSTAVRLANYLIQTILFWQERYGDQPIYRLVWALVFLIDVWLAFKIYAGRRWARSVYALFTAVGLLGLVETFRLLAVSPVGSLLDLLSYVLAVAALYLLFRSPAKQWFEHEAASRRSTDQPQTAVYPAGESGEFGLGDQEREEPHADEEAS